MHLRLLFTTHVPQSMAQEHMPRVSTPLFQSLLLNLLIRLVGVCVRRE